MKHLVKLGIGVGVICAVMLFIWSYYWAAARVVMAYRGLSYVPDGDAALIMGFPVIMFTGYYLGSIVMAEKEK